MTLVSEGLPSRQGYFKVTLKDGTSTIAQFAKSKTAPKENPYIWQSFKSEHPTIKKEPYELNGDFDVISYDKVSQDEVDRFLKRELTSEEKIEDVYSRYKSLNYKDSSEYHNIVPPNRRLEVGDKVVIGNLDDCVVEGLRENGTVVIASFTAKASCAHLPQSGNFGGNRYLWVGSWSSVYKESEYANANSNFASDFKIYGSSRISDLSGLIHSCLHSGLVLDPDYQRGYVWSDEDKSSLIESIFESRDIGSFILYKRPPPDYRLEVIDGKQRISAILDFYTSKFAYKGVYYHQLSFKDRIHFERFAATWTEINQVVSRKYLLQVFLHVNVTGVPQDKSHLSHVKSLLSKESD